MKRYQDQVHAHLHASFNQDFQHGGRLYTSGFPHVQGLKASERPRITINGESVASVTLSHCHSVHIGLSETNTGYMAVVTVTDDCANAVVCSAFSVGIGADAPEEATASGSNVIAVPAE